MAHKHKLDSILGFSEASECEDNIIELKTWMSRLRCNKDDQIKSSSVANAELVLTNDSNLAGTIAYNEFSGYIHLLKGFPRTSRTAGEREDSFEDALTAYIEENHNIVFDDNKIHKVVVNVAKENIFNPVKERIGKVKRDQQPRLETLSIDLLGVDDDLYTREVTKRQIVGSAARIYKPGIKFGIAPVSDGPRGIGKSTIPALLYTDDSFTDPLDSLGEKKDDYMQLQDNVITELGELSSMNKTKIGRVKNFINARIDKIKLSYGRNVIAWARQRVFIGMSNDGQYLRDDTGNRHFYPLPCKDKPKMNLFKTEDEYFLRVLAEAKVFFDKGQRIYFSPDKDKEVLEIAKDYQGDIKTESPIKEVITKYLEVEIPYKWEEAPAWARCPYYQNYPDSKYNEKNLQHFYNGATIQQEFYLIDSALTADILEAVFDKQAKDLLNGRSDAETKKIALIISSIPGWERKQLSKRNKRRGFYNKSNAYENKN